MSNIKIIDLFCGAGGLTTGAMQVKGVEVIACVNHDETAIESHKANHPSVIHFPEDIRDMKVVRALKKLVDNIRIDQPECIVLIWASLECTNFSKAKGGLPRDADSRTLADYLDHYIEAINPDGLWIENVEEFMCWGPLDENGKPVSRYCGADYLKWSNRIQGYGYKFDHKILNAADFGAYTSRKRFFGQFIRKGWPMYWPTPTHAKQARKDVFTDLKKWKAVKDVLDFSDKGKSIFIPGRIRSEKTFARILAGLIKYVAGGDESFLKKYYSGRPMGKVISVDGPAGTITTIDGQALVQCAFLMQQKGGDPNHKVYATDRPSRTVTTAYHDQMVQMSYLVEFRGNSTVKSLENPSPTLLTKDKHGLVQPAFLVKYYGTAKTSGSDEPAGTLTTKDRFAAVWVDKQYGSDANHQSVDQPAGSILSNDKHALMQTFLVKNFTSGGQHNSVDGPSGSLLTVPKENLVTIEGWIMDTNFQNTGRSIDDPAPTQLACRKHNYLVNPQYNSKGRDTDSPCFTLIARMDKMPPYLVQIQLPEEEEGQMAILIYPEDPEPLQKIKLFMAEYGITDIYMRMLRIDELLRIQGFPEGYVLKGTKTQQKKFIGNSVEVNMGRVLIEEQAKGLSKANGAVA